ncbi:carboxylic ester hydrolase [Plakobranchus ocellatus]|uniref:Carboxylic ester hydrolase n=1 Tax=Plakobranchus ocellatus TaxID=259542 RepID=A0AAV3ZWI4_9GAST|nr:carboxylic ester hydrolase [Plakobranchus ocellatus]
MTIWFIWTRSRRDYERLTFGQSVDESEDELGQPITEWINSMMTHCLTALFLLCVLGLDLGHSQSVTVWTSKGYIQGFTQGQTIKFLGIPYATAQRYQYPVTDLPAWSGVVNATSHGAMCYQQCSSKDVGLFCTQQKSEDCLTLNVDRPLHNPSQGANFPVVVYIHGGDFSSGSGSAPIYDADYFASRGHVIIVTINYRLGAFGFLSIFDKYGDAAGNFGFRDQQAALAWIRDNISAFSGDPNRITLIGDGSGCLSAVSHLASPVSQHLFDSVVLHSCPWMIPFRTRGEARSQAQAFSAALGCAVNDVACYRLKAADDILRAQTAVQSESYSGNALFSFYPWGPTIDDHEIFHSPYDVFKETTRFASKPMILGVTADEGVSFVYRKFPMPLSRGKYDTFISSSKIRNTASASNTTRNGNVDMRESLIRFINHHVFVCPMVFVAKQVERKHSQSRGGINLGRSSSSTQAAPKLWLYEFTQPTKLPESLTVQQQLLTNALWAQKASENVCEGRSCHGSDIRALFYSSALPLIERLKTEELSKQMIRYWANFARYRNVNGIIGSRAHLRTLQIRSALITDSSSRGFSRQRSQTVSFPLGGLNVRQLSSPARLSLQNALASFTYWPEYSSQGSEPLTTMMLQRQPVEIRRNVWQQKCGLSAVQQQQQLQRRWG